MLKGLNVYLIGMMGAGKTTIGSLLAEQLGYRFFDTDTLIEQASSMKIADIFANVGEEGFRQIETTVLAELSSRIYATIATGGGIVLRRENWGYLHYGLVLWLDIPLDLLVTRLAGDESRPLLKNEDPKAKLAQLFAERKSLYAQADLRIAISEGETPQQIVVRMLEAIPTVLKLPSSTVGSN